jgi:hypothetical protein
VPYPPPAVCSDDVIGFPPGRSFLLVPRRPRRAVAAALALYEAVEPRQRILLAAAQVGAAVGAPRLVRPVAEVPPGLDPTWWAAWTDAVARPEVGPVAQVAFRVPPNGRVAALLLAEGGEPVGFAKVLPRPPGPLHDTINRALQAGSAFAAPMVLAEGTFRGVTYRLDTPLPAGAHRRPPHDPPRIRAVIDEWQSQLASLAPPPEVPPDWVVCHGDFTPRNLRVFRDAGWWLIDWDNARWGPRLADELHYWCAEYCWRWRPRADRDARRVLSLLRERGTDREIAAAAAWSQAPERTYRASERRLRAAVGALAGRDTGGDR